MDEERTYLNAITSIRDGLKEKEKMFRINVSNQWSESCPNWKGARMQIYFDYLENK